MEKFTNQKMKTTSIGQIPEDWEVKSLSQIGIFSKGKGVTRANAQSGAIPCVRYGEIYTSHNDYIRTFYSHISPEIAATATKLKKGDILFAGSGETKEEIGKAVAFLGDEEAYAGGDIIILSPNESSSSKFLGYVLNAATAVNQKASMGQGDAVVHIHAKELGDVVIPFPKLEEQKKIADALSGVDDMIGALDGAIAKKQQIKEGLMQQLLTGKTRLPGFSGEWVEMRFDDFISRFATGLNPRNNFRLNVDASNYYITIKDFADGVLYFDHCDKVSDEAIKRINERSDLRAGDVLFSSIGRVGDAYVIEETPTNWNINESVFSLRPNPTIVDSHFLYYLIKSKDAQAKFQESITGTTLRSIKMGHLKEILCCFPSKIEEQKAIANALNNIDADIISSETMRDKYRLIKQGMMQELLTGKTRL